LTAKSTVQSHRLLKDVQSLGRYNAKTYEPRPEIERHINHFLASPQTGLVIFGESGVGKTNVLTHLCQQLLNDGQVVLFYNGLDFTDNLNVEQRILEDCGCMHKIPSLRELLATLDTLNQTAEHLTDFVVLVDSVEIAAEPAHLLRVLDSIISNVSYSWFKVIVTVQTGAYKGIAEEHDKIRWRPITPTKYYLSDGKTTSTVLPGVMLEPFDFTELQGAWNKAEIGISLKSLPEASRNLIQHPYFFRLFVELYKKPSTDVVALLTVSTTWELSRRYYETHLPALAGEGRRRRNPSRVLLNELINRLLEKRFIWFSILELTEDTTLGRYFTDYEANRPYADLLTSSILLEHATPDKNVIVSFTPNQLFAYALYEYLRGHNHLNTDNIVAIVTDLLPGPMGFRLEEVTNLDETFAAIEYFRTLRNFWYPPLVEAIAHLLADHWNAGEQETFVVKFLVDCYAAPGALWAYAAPGAFSAAEGISIKLIEVIACTNPKELGQLIPTMVSVHPVPILSIVEDRILGQLFNDLAENALTQEATSIVNSLLTERSNSPAEIVELYLVLARVYRAAHNDERRLENLLEANRHATASGDIAKIGRVANAIGVFYNETDGDPATAIQWLEQGLEFAAKAGQPQESIAASHFNIGVALATQRDFPRAVSHLEQSLKLTDIKETPLRAAQILTKIGKAQEAQRNFGQALNAYQQASSLYEANNQAEQVVDLAFHIGGILMMTRQFPQAVDHFRRCLEKGDSSLSADQRFALMANLALALAGKGNTTDAMDWFQKANEYHDNTGLSLTQDYFITQLNFARFLADSKNYPQAIAVYTNSLSKFNLDGEDVLRYTMKSELGIAYLEAGNFDLALDYIRDALPFFEMRQDELPLAILYANLGTVYKKKGMTAQAVEYYRKSHPLLLKFGMDELATNLQAEIAKI
jgi:tetratricopeptide (TPR) repeat protein